MSQEEIEQEIQARVEFKFKELKDAVKNTAQNNWHAAMGGGHPKYTYYWEAFEQLKSMIDKEVVMATPYNDMAAKRKREAKNKAVDNIMERLEMMMIGRIHYEPILHTVVKEIENAQNF